MEIVEKGTIGSKGWCALCHEIEGPFLDTGRWIGQGTSVDEYGYLCLSCVRDVGKALGMVTAEEHEALVTELTVTKAGIDTLSQAYEEQAEELDAFKKVKELTAA